VIPVESAEPQLARGSFRDAASTLGVRLRYSGESGNPATMAARLRGD